MQVGRPVPNSIAMLECTIKRDKSGLTKKMYPKYDLMLSYNQQCVITGQRMSVFGSAHYIVTLPGQNMDKHATGYLGKVRSNKAGLEYNIFDEGENPAGGFPVERIRNLHGSVLYVREILKWSRSRAK